MSKEDLERIDDQGMAAWGDHNPQAFVDQLADDFVLKDLSMPEPIRTKEGATAYVQAWITAFPDMSITRTNRVVGQDSVAGEVEFRGTNTGPMMMAGKEIPPTGKSVIGRGAYFARVRDGKVVEFSAHPDIAGMMMQLGFMPPM